MQNGFVHESGLLYYVQQVSLHNLPVPTGAKVSMMFIRTHTIAFFFLHVRIPRGDRLKPLSDFITHTASLALF